MLNSFTASIRFPLFRGKKSILEMEKEKTLVSIP